MRLLDDVCLIESEVLAQPISSTFERSITKLASYEHSDSWTKLCNGSWESDRKTSLEENREKIANIFCETRFSQGQESAEPVSVEHRSVEYSRSRAAGYPKILLVLAEGFETTLKSHHSTALQKSLEILAEILKSHKSEILKIDPSVRISLYISTFAFIACAYHTPRRVWLARLPPNYQLATECSNAGDSECAKS